MIEVAQERTPAGGSAGVSLATAGSLAIPTPPVRGGPPEPTVAPPVVAVAPQGAHFVDGNALRLDGSATPPVPITRDMFPCPACPAGAAGTYTYQTTLGSLGSKYTLREPRKTFRFSVATTF